MPKSSTEKTTAAGLEEFLQDKAQQYQKVFPLLRVLNQGIRTHMYEAALESLKAGTPIAEIVKDLKEALRADPNNISCRDVLQFIESGAPLLPRDIFDLPAYLMTENRKRDAALAARIAQQAAEAEAERKRRIEQENRALRSALAEDLGLPSDALEKLAGASK